MSNKVLVFSIHYSIWDLAYVVSMAQLIREHFDGLVQDCSNSIAYAMELLQSCTKSSICNIFQWLRAHWAIDRKKKEKQA